MSHSYYQSPVALIVRSDRAGQFLDRATIAAMPGLRLAVFDDPVLVPMLHRLFPMATIKVLPDYDHLAALGDSVDARDLDAAAGRRLGGGPSRIHRGRAIRHGQPDPDRLSAAARRRLFRQYLDQWLELKANEGFRKAAIDYWIDGRPRAERKPRWNLLDALADGR